MSTEAASVDSGAITPSLDALTEKDHFLQHLVDITNQFPENKIDVALQMGGMLVSGTIISGDEYFKRIAEKLSDSDDEQKKWASWGDLYREERESGLKSDYQTVFIHLEDCTFNGPTPLHTIKGLWRGRLSKVEGFVFGYLSTGTSK